MTTTATPESLAIPSSCYVRRASSVTDYFVQSAITQLMGAQLWRTSSIVICPLGCDDVGGDIEYTGAELGNRLEHNNKFRGVFYPGDSAMMQAYGGHSEYPATLTTGGINRDHFSFTLFWHPDESVLTSLLEKFRQMS